MLENNENKINENKSGIITCEDCFSIPKITILAKDEIKIECPLCKKEKTKPISYFEIFTKKLKESKFKDLPKCTFKEAHESKSLKYCFKCTKYLCKDCIEIHNSIFKDHQFLLEQNLNNKFKCDKEGHEDFILYRYCTKCNVYLCSLCKCNHENKYIYDFEDKQNHHKEVESIADKIKKCEVIIVKEEKKFNKFVEELNNQIKSLKALFTDYKERNIKLISFYKLLINNYYQFNTIRNYNLNNNVIINNYFDITNSDDFVYKENCYDEECFSSQYNRLCNFYKMKNHIKTNQYFDYNITKKFCDKKTIKKCIFLNQDEIIFFFKNDHILYHIKTFKNNENKNLYIDKIDDNSEYIKDIYKLANNSFISFDNNKNLKLWEIKEDKFTSTIMTNNNYYAYAIQDKVDLNNFFFINNETGYYILQYYIYNSKKLYPLFCLNKHFSFEDLYETINEVIRKTEIKEGDKKILLDLFKEKKNEISKMIENDLSLLKIIDEKYKKIYENLLKIIENDKDKENNIPNSNYIHYKILKELKNNKNIKDNEIKEIKYFLKFIQFCKTIRKNYIHYIAFNSINNIYNYNNNEIIFVGGKYLFINYSLKKAEFSHLVTLNFLPETNLNNVEIKQIYENKIILNDIDNNIAYIIVDELVNNERILLIKNKYKYYNSFVVYKNYLIYNNFNNKVEFVIKDLDNLNQLNHELKGFLNLELYYNIPKFLSYNYGKFISVYQDNQLCIMNINLFKEDNNKINHNFPIKIKNENQNFSRIIIPNISNSSPTYNNLYVPETLFKNNGYYYCSCKYAINPFIEFDFKEEFYFFSFDITYENSRSNKPKNYNIEFYDNKKRKINTIEFISEKDKNSESNFINEKARYLKLNLTSNYGGNYFEIKKINFSVLNFFSLMP